MAVPAIRRLCSVHGPKNVCVIVRGQGQRQFLAKLISTDLRVIERDDGKPCAHLRLWLKLAWLRPKYISAPMLSLRAWRRTYFSLLCTSTIVPSDFIGRRLVRLSPASICMETYSGHQVNYFVQFLAEREPLLDRSTVSVNEWSFDSSDSLKGDLLLDSPPRVVVGISCGKLERHKIPSPEWIAKLANGLDKEKAIKLVIIGSREDLPLVDRLIASLDDGVKAEILLDLPVDRLLSELQNCSLGISGTTGQGHMMAVAKLPMLILAGVTNPYESGPYVRRAMVLSHNFACGPCYQKFYTQGCGKVACMETLEVSKGVCKALELLRDPASGSSWLNQLICKPPYISTEVIETLHRRPTNEWLKIAE